MKVSIFTEAGQGIGFGHVARMRSLAAALRGEGAEVVMGIQWEGMEAPPGEEGEVSLAWRDAEGMPGTGEMVIVDSYRASGERIAAFRDGAFVVVVDDYARLPYAVDLVANPNPHGPALAYPGVDAPVISGADYVLLRDAFARTPPKPPAPSDPPRILVTLGGDDTHGLLPVLLPLFGEAVCGFEVICADDALAHALASSAGKNVVLHGRLDAGAMRAVMERCGAAISAGGQTLHELAYLGIPPGVVRVGDDQIGNIGVYRELGFFDAVAIAGEDDVPAHVRGEVARLSDAGERAARRKAVEGFIDGRGAARLAGVLLERAGEK